MNRPYRQPAPDERRCTATNSDVPGWRCKNGVVTGEAICGLHLYQVRLAKKKTDRQWAIAQYRHEKDNRLDAHIKRVGRV